MSPADSAALKDQQRRQAEQDIQDIRALHRLPAFDRYFCRRLREMEQAYAKEVLYSDEITPADREFKRQRILELRRVLTLIEMDEANFTRLLQGRM